MRSFSQNQFDVYGIGHALVDLQFGVTEDILAALGVHKGVMTLIDETRQQELIETLPAEPLKSASGGSAANTMIAVARFGGRPYYACRVGDDAWGGFYRDDLERAGVTSNLHGSCSGKTGQCVVLVTPDADRTMSTFLGVSDSMGPDQLEEEALRASQFVYIEGYLVTSDPGFAACLAAQRLARDHGVSVSLTLSDPSIVEIFRARFEDLIAAGVDLLLCNEDEARALSEKTDRRSACEAIAKLTPRACVTCGPEGAVVLDGGGGVNVSGVDVDAVDTTGAGDAFAGGVLYGLAHGFELADSARLGCFAGARVVSVYGPRLEHNLEEQVPDIVSGRLTS